MYRFIILLFITLFSSNSFSFKLTPQDDGRVIIYNDRDEYIDEFHEDLFSIELSNIGKTVNVFNKYPKFLIKQYHEEDINDNATTYSASSSMQRIAGDTAFFFDFPEFTDDELNEFHDIFESNDDGSASTSPVKDDGAAGAAALKAVEDSYLPSWTTASTQTSPVKGGGAAGATSSSSQDSENSSTSENTSKVTYLEGPYEHHSALLGAINSATSYLEICSDTVTFLDADIYGALKRAYERGVKIHVFYRKNIHPMVKRSLEKIGHVYKIKLHAKFLIVDYSSIIIGSQNWLDRDFKGGINKSFKISDNTEQTSEIINLASCRIIDYANSRHTEHTPPSLRKKYAMSDDSDYSESGITHFSVLTSTKEHEDFLMEACKKAHKNLVIHSPFVTLYNAKTRIEKLAKMANPGVKITIKAWDSEDFQKLVDFVKRNPRYEKIFKFYLMANDNHSKMIMIDDMKLWSQGSFNWMSSSLTETARGHNLDATVVLEKLDY